jgi:hypothetical protein
MKLPGPRTGPKVLRLRPDGAYEYFGSAGKTVSKPSGFGKDVVLAWMRDAGVDVDNVVVETEAARIAVLGRDASRPVDFPVGRSSAVGGSGDFFTEGPWAVGRSSYAASQPLPMLRFLPLAWVVPWAIGLRFLFHHRKRTLMPTAAGG